MYNHVISTTLSNRMIEKLQRIMMVFARDKMISVFFFKVFILMKSFHRD